MSNAQPEPSMEEILASIRRIISDDGEDEAPGPAPSAPRPRATPAAAPVLRPSVVKKDEPVQPPADEDRAQSHLRTEDVEMIKKSTVEASAEDVVVDPAAESAAARAFHTLSQTVKVSSKDDGRTLEDIVVEILRPLVKQWLDENLPQIVGEKVEAEVQRVARLRR
jgi:hypothetical protein